MANTIVDHNMKKIRQYIDKDGNILDSPKGKIIKQKDTFNINDIPKEEAKEIKSVNVEAPKSSLEEKIQNKINSKIESIIDKKIDDILSKML